jgi:hypothetical protein
MIKSFLEFAADQTWFPIVTGVVTLAAAITAVTPTPKPGSWLSKMYLVLDILALNIGKAKDRGMPRDNS